jgi:predicted phage baseplate assembly protein
VNSDVWKLIDDLLSAGPEVPVTPRFPFAPSVRKNKDPKVFTLNPESGEIRFGDGFRGARPPINAVVRADYDYGSGSAGNVGAGSINKGPALPSGIKVTNPLPTWGGADPEKVSDGEKQISRYLSHRDRLVTLTDFETITSRTPGVDIGRVEIIPAFNPDLDQKELGNAPGAVTIMVIPRYDKDQPDAPLPSRDFINSVCDHIDPRRLVTTEVFLRAPKYVPVWISMGISVVGGESIAEVIEEVKRTILQYLSPLPAVYSTLLDVDAAKQFAQQYPELNKGWPLRNPVVAQQLLSVAARVTDVSMVYPRVLIAMGSVDDKGQMTTSEEETVEMKGLELPRVMAISVTAGEPVELDVLISGKTVTTTPPGTMPQVPKSIPVPIIPEECR